MILVICDLTLVLNDVKVLAYFMKKRDEFSVDAASNRRAFTTRKYPTFGRGVYSEANPPKTVTASPFYWWFKFLQLNEQYKKAIAGEATTISPTLMADFGDVSNIDFKTWWSTRSHLFAEPLTEYRMYIPRNAAEIAAFDNSNVMNLVVPLDWTNVGIKRRFAQIIDKLVERTPRGVRTNKASSAQYKLGRKWSPVGLKHAYDVYVAKQHAVALGEQRGKPFAWADIGILAKLPAAGDAELFDLDTSTYNTRRVLTAQCIRHYGQAMQFIAASASNMFPAPLPPKAPRTAPNPNTLVHQIR